MFKIPALTLCSNIGKANKLRKMIKAEEDINMGLHAKIEYDNLRARNWKLALPRH